MASVTITRRAMRGAPAFVAEVEAAAASQGCKVAYFHVYSDAQGTDVVVRLVGPPDGVDQMRALDYLGFL